MITIKNEFLKSYLEFLFRKKVEYITVEELLRVENIVLKIMDKKETTQSFSQSDLEMLPNLKVVTIEGSHISSNCMQALGKKTYLETMNFIRCSFEKEADLKYVNKIKQLDFRNCFIRDFSFLMDFRFLLALSISNPYLDIPIDLSKIENNKNIAYIDLMNCIVENMGSLQQLPELTFLSLMKVEVDDFDTLLQLPHLQKLYIEERYRNNIAIKLLIDKKVEVNYNLISLAFEREKGGKAI